MTTTVTTPNYFKSMGRKKRDPLHQRINWRFRSILIVDDVTANYQIVHDALATTKAKLLHARSGIEALSMCFEDKRIDLVLIEVNLPGKNAFDFVRDLKFIRPEVTVIGQSAFIGSHLRQDYIDAGFDDFFIKPIQPKELVAIIRSCLVNNDKRV